MNKYKAIIYDVDGTILNKQLYQPKNTNNTK